MGFSEWLHVDFDCIREVNCRRLVFSTPRGKIYSVPKSVVADVDDYQSGDGDGVISIKESYAIAKGIE